MGLFGMDRNEANNLLFDACQAGLVSHIRKALESGADANFRVDGATGLHWAASGGRERCVRIMLAAGADPNAADKDGECPMHWAARRGTPEVVHALRGCGANPNTASHDGTTPLMLASSPKLAVALLECGADARLLDRNGRDAAARIKVRAERIVDGMERYLARRQELPQMRGR